jgi:ABC-type anion transport system duplicated permease subunit
MILLIILLGYVLPILLCRQQARHVLQLKKTDILTDVPVVWFIPFANIIILFCSILQFAKSKFLNSDLRD